MRRRVVLLACAAFAAVAAFAQEEGIDQYLDKPIRDFTFTGLASVSAAELRPVVRPYIGKPFTIDLYGEVQDKLLKLEYFDLVEGVAHWADTEHTAVVVEVQVKERPTVASIEVRGNSGLRTQTILDKALIKKGDMASEPLVGVDVEAIRSLYLEKGYTKVQVSGRMELDEAKNAASVIFEITEGPQAKVRNILFSGNTFASESTLRRLMKTKKQSLLNTGDYQESLLQGDKKLIADYYGKNGFIDAAVVKDEKVSVEEDNKLYWDITLYIEEGQQYTLAGLEFQGNELFDAAQINEAAHLKTGKPVNTEQVSAAIARVQQLYHDDGYLETLFAPSEKRDADTNSVTYIVQITESDRVHIENIIISGNEKTKDYVIRRELPFEEGDIYSIAKIQQGYYNLSNLQYFGSVDVTFPLGSAKGLRDLVITVEEQSTASFNFGFQVSGGDSPVSGTIGWSENNFLGRGQSISVNSTLSTTEQSLSLSFGEPYLFGKRWSGKASLSASHSLVSGVPQDILGPVFSDDDYRNGLAVPDPYDGHYVYSSGDNAGKAYDFTVGGTVDPTTLTAAEIAQIVKDQSLVTDYVYADKKIPEGYTMSYQKVGFSLGLQTGVRIPTEVGTFRIDPYLVSTLDYKTYDATLYRPYQAEDREGLDSWLLVDTIGVGLTWDKRDYWVNPQKGFYLKEALTSVGGPLLGWKHYIKTSTTAEAYYPLITVPVTDAYTFKLVLGVHSSLSFMLPQFHPDSTAADGSWTWSTVAETSDKLYIDGMTNGRGWSGENLYGEALWESQIELRLPLAEQLLWWTFFFDVAGIWSEPSGFGKMGIEDYYFSFGAGFRLTHPQVPIRLYLGKGFRISNGAVDWKTGDLDLGAFSLDFVVSLGTQTF